MAYRQTNPYIDLIDSDSDPPLPTSSSYPTSSSSSKHSYQDILSFRKLHFTANLQNHYTSLKNFLQTATYNVLFIFGPSGCGKRLLV